MHVFGKGGNVKCPWKRSSINRKTINHLKSEMQKRRKNLVLSYVLLIFLGVLGIHKFYLGKNSQGVKYLVLFIAAWILGAGSIIFGGIGTLVGGEGGGLAAFGISTLFGFIFMVVLWCFLLYDLFTLPSQVDRINEDIEDEIIAQLMNVGSSMESRQQ